MQLTSKMMVSGCAETLQTCLAKPDQDSNTLSVAKESLVTIGGALQIFMMCLVLLQYTTRRHGYYVVNTCMLILIPLFHGVDGNVATA